MVLTGRLAVRVDGPVFDGLSREVHVRLFKAGPMRGYLEERHVAFVEKSNDLFGREARDRQRVRVNRGDGCTGAGKCCRRFRTSRRAQRDQTRRCLADQLGDAGVGDQPTATDHHEMRGGAFQLAHQMAGHKDRPTLRRQRAQEAAHPHDAFGIQAVERFVEHQHGRITEHGRSDAEPLTHTERIATGLAPGGLLKAGLSDDLIDSPARQALRVRQPQQMVASGAAGLERRGVQQATDLGERVRPASIWPPPDSGAALVNGVEAEDGPHRGGLARAVGTDEARDLAWAHSERDAVEGDDWPESLVQAVDRDSGFHGTKARYRRPSRSSPWRAIFAVPNGRAVPHGRDTAVTHERDA